MKNLIELTSLDIVVIVVYIVILLGIAYRASFGKKKNKKAAIVIRVSLANSG